MAVAAATAAAAAVATAAAAAAPTETVWAVWAGQTAPVRAGVQAAAPISANAPNTGSGWAVEGCVGVLEPPLEQWLQFAHVLEAEVQSLEATDGRLAEVIAVQLAHRQADVALGEA